MLSTSINALGFSRDLAIFYSIGFIVGKSSPKPFVMLRHALSWLFCHFSNFRHGSSRFISDIILLQNCCREKCGLNFLAFPFSRSEPSLKDIQLCGKHIECLPLLFFRCFRVDVHGCLNVAVPHDGLNDLQIRFVFTKTGAESMPQIMR